jgi:hypothetical protein
MRFVKDTTNQCQGVYKVVFSYEKCYIGEARKSFHVRIKEHNEDNKNNHIHTYALTYHSLKTMHHVCLEYTNILAREDHYYKCRFREALEILKHPNTQTRDKGFDISGSWFL